MPIEPDLRRDDYDRECAQKAAAVDVTKFVTPGPFWAMHTPWRPRRAAASRRPCVPHPARARSGCSGCRRSGRGRARPCRPSRRCRDTCLTAVRHERLDESLAGRHLGHVTLPNAMMSERCFVQRLEAGSDAAVSVSHTQPRGVSSIVPPRPMPAASVLRSGRTIRGRSARPCRMRTDGSRTPSRVRPGQRPWVPTAASTFAFGSDDRHAAPTMPSMLSWSFRAKASTDSRQLGLELGDTDERCARCWPSVCGCAAGAWRTSAIEIGRRSTLPPEAARHPSGCRSPCAGAAASRIFDALQVRRSRDRRARRCCRSRRSHRRGLAGST